MALLRPECYTCDECGCDYVSLTQHFRRNPECELPHLLVDDDDVSSSDEEEFSTGCGAETAQSLQQRLSQDARQEQIASDLADLRFEHGLDEAAITKIKSNVTAWNKQRVRELQRELSPFLHPNTDSEALAQVLDCDYFKGLQTPKLEMAEMRRRVPYLEPRVVKVGDKEEVVSFSIIDLITRRLQHDIGYRKRCIEKSDEWKTGEKWKVEEEGEIKDFDDGVEARFHPHLMRKATDDEQNDVRIAIST